jgi:membrane fusion protein, adhesin transport system
MVELNDTHEKSWQYRPLFWALVIFLLFFSWWASTTEIDQHVRGIGKIIPAGKTRVIQHLEGGIITDILVSEGEKITEGQVLFHIANKGAEAELRELGIAVSSLELRKVRLQAEKSENTETVEFPEELEKRHPAIAESERRIFEARQAEINEKIDGLEKRMRQKVLKLDELNTNIKNLRQELSVAREQLEIKTQLRKTGAISRSQYLETESEVKNFNTRIAKVEKEIPITKSELGEIINLLEETKQNWQSKIAEDINSINVDLRKIEERIAALSDEVNRTAVISPVNGVVNKLNFNTIGGVVQPGAPIAEIIPLEETLVLEGRISTNDRGKVWPGLPVVAKITAYDYTIYGGIDGVLTYISADSFIDNQNQEYYQVRVTLKTEKMSEDKPVFPGMTAEMSILAGKISVMHALLKPIFNIRENALREF